MIIANGQKEMFCLFFWHWLELLVSNYYILLQVEALHFYISGFGTDASVFKCL